MPGAFSNAYNNDYNISESRLPVGDLKLFYQQATDTTGNYSTGTTGYVYERRNLDSFTRTGSTFALRISMDPFITQNNVTYRRYYTIPFTNIPVTQVPVKVTIRDIRPSATTDYYVITALVVQSDNVQTWITPPDLIQQYSSAGVLKATISADNVDAGYPVITLPPAPRVALTQTSYSWIRWTQGKILPGFTVTRGVDPNSPFRPPLIPSAHIPLMLTVEPTLLKKGERIYMRDDSDNSRNELFTGVIDSRSYTIEKSENEIYYFLDLECLGNSSLVENLVYTPSKLVMKDIITELDAVITNIGVGVLSENYTNTNSIKYWKPGPIQALPVLDNMVYRNSEWPARRYELGDGDIVVRNDALSTTVSTSRTVGSDVEVTEWNESSLSSVVYDYWSYDESVLFDNLNSVAFHFPLISFKFPFDHPDYSHPDQIPAIYKDVGVNTTRSDYDASDSETWVPQQSWAYIGSGSNQWEYIGRWDFEGQFAGTPYRGIVDIDDLPGDTKNLRFGQSGLNLVSNVFRSHQDFLDKFDITFDIRNNGRTLEYEIRQKNKLRSSAPSNTDDPLTATFTDGVWEFIPNQDWNQKYPQYSTGAVLFVKCTRVTPLVGTYPDNYLSGGQELDNWPGLPQTTARQIARSYYIRERGDLLTVVLPFTINSEISDLELYNLIQFVWVDGSIKLARILQQTLYNYMHNVYQATLLVSVLA